MYISMVIISESYKIFGFSPSQSQQFIAIFLLAHISPIANDSAYKTISFPTLLFLHAKNKFINLEIMTN